MEISLMVSQLKAESDSILSVLNEKKERADTFRAQLEVLDLEIRGLQDRYDAVHMAYEALETVTDVPAEKSAPVAEPEPVPEPVKYSRRPKKIGQFDAKGKKIAEFVSINQAAKAFGWNNTSMSKYIQNVGKDKQIRLRGFYLEFIAA